MPYRVYVEKKPGFDHEARALLADLTEFLGVRALDGLRLLNRYDVENLSGDALSTAVRTVFSEPQVDLVYAELPPFSGRVFASEYLPGQFDQRADSAAQCVQLQTRGERPLVRTATVYLLSGALDDASFEAIKRYVINPVERREAALSLPETLRAAYPPPAPTPVLTDFSALPDEALPELLGRYALAMDTADLRFCRDHFAALRRDPTLTELRMIDTYWSDHCRHTTFLTRLSDVSFDDPDAQNAYAVYRALAGQLGRADKPVTLMDLATIGAKALVRRGVLTDLDESEEINACTIKLDVPVDGRAEPWLLLFKNETHNHPTEIEPFGGAATCIGGAIRDPLSGRGYVYQAMRVTGAGDPTAPACETLPGKLPQRKLTTTAAAGYASYGNQIGLATGVVDEWYHPGYVAKRMEIGAVIGAAPASHVRRETPLPGDLVVLLGGRTGRDGCGGATGSSKAHDASSLALCGAEVQKGNAPEERKLQRLFRNGAASRLIKRCNDFGAGGVSVAIGELADGLKIDLTRVPKKYDGLTATELAISESQERMAVVLDPADLDAFLALAAEENLEATVVATVTQEKRLVMTAAEGVVVDLDRAFLNSNGAPKTATAHVEAPSAAPRLPRRSLEDALRELAQDLNVCDKRGLAERFDATIGSGSVLMPFGGRRQKTPAQAMAALLPVPRGETRACSVMAFGGNPYAMARSPYRGAYEAVAESLARLAATGAPVRGAHLTFQEYFERMTGDATRWGKPLAALLGALMAQLDFEVAAIGGKDSMSGSFEHLDVPPTLVSFAVAVTDASRVVSPEFKRPGHRVVCLAPDAQANGLPDPASLRRNFDLVDALIERGQIAAAATPGFGGALAQLFKMCLGNAFGLTLYPSFDPQDAVPTGTLLLELTDDAPDVGRPVGRVCADYALGDVPLAPIERLYEDRLEKVFPSRTPDVEAQIPVVDRPAAQRRACGLRVARPRVLIPVFPGTNCEYDSARAFERAGASAEVFVVRNQTPADVAESARSFAERLNASQIVFLPGGFSGGDEPDGSGKFITAFFRNPAIADAAMALLDRRDGLIGGVCNGFQALVKLGLLPYGEIRDVTSDDPTLTYNVIGRHQSRLVRARVASNASPWLMLHEVGDTQLLPVSHGEGRFVADAATRSRLAQNGQIATQYVDASGCASMRIEDNPNGSVYAIEGITSPDGRVFGRMAHAERFGPLLYRNVPGDKCCKMFEGAVHYFG